MSNTLRSIPTKEAMGWKRIQFPVWDITVWASPSFTGQSPDGMRRRQSIFFMNVSRAFASYKKGKRFKEVVDQERQFLRQKGILSSLIWSQEPQRLSTGMAKPIAALAEE